MRLCSRMARSWPAVNPASSSAKGRRPMPCFSASFNVSGVALSVKCSSLSLAGKSGGVLQYNNVWISCNPWRLYNSLPATFKCCTLSTQVFRATRTQWGGWNIKYRRIGLHLIHGFNSVDLITVPDNNLHVWVFKMGSTMSPCYLPKDSITTFHIRHRNHAINDMRMIVRSDILTSTWPCSHKVTKKRHVEYGWQRKCHAMIDVPCIKILGKEWLHHKVGSGFFDQGRNA